MRTEQAQPDETQESRIVLSPNTSYGATLLGEYLNMDKLEAIQKATKTLIAMTDAMTLGGRWVSSSSIGNLDLDIDPIIRRSSPDFKIPQDKKSTSITLKLTGETNTKIKAIAERYNMPLEEIIMAGFRLAADMKERHLNGEEILCVNVLTGPDDDEESFLGTDGTILD